MNDEERRGSRGLQVQPVHVYVPGQVAGDLESMERLTKDILGRLGCRGCHSGFDINYIQFEKEVSQVPAFTVTPELEVTEAFR